MFIIADANISFPKCKFSIGSFSLSPHHFIIGSVSTFKNDDVSMLKTFTHGHSCVMKFLHLKVHWFSFSNFPLAQFSLPHHVWFQYLRMAMLKTFIPGDISVVYPMCSFTLPDIYCKVTDIYTHTHISTHKWILVTGQILMSAHTCTHTHTHTYKLLDSY